MNLIGVQSMGVIEDTAPKEGFQLLKDIGFECVDFSLHKYLKNKEIYAYKKNAFFDKTSGQLEQFFTPHKEAAKAAGVIIGQLHMPYPLFIPEAGDLNEYLCKTVAFKSLDVCAFFHCHYIVVHGFKLVKYLGSEQAEWMQTREFLLSLIPLAKERKITICLENLYDSFGGHITEGPCTDAVRMAKRIDCLNEEAGDEVFGFCFDTGHANLLSIDFESFITTLGNRIKVLHIHDNDGISDLHQIPFTFTQTRDNLASTDWDSFLRGLKAIHYGGVISFETGPVLYSFPNELHRDALSLIYRIGNYFAKEISYEGL